MRAKAVDRPFGVRDKVGYLFGDFGCNMSFTLLSSYLMLYMTQGMGSAPTIGQYRYCRKSVRRNQ